jgi:2-hydroxychromene-2-carboxylate isomerase
VNDHPLDAHFIAEEVDDIRAQVAAPRFAGFREAAFPTSSLPAMALAAAAYEVDLPTGERVSLALRDLLFEQGVDIADPEVLAHLAADVGVTADLDDTAAVLADHEEGRARGVIGSPHFFTPAGSFFCPSLDISRDAKGHLRITADEGFEPFVEACLQS